MSIKTDRYMRFLVSIVPGVILLFGVFWLIHLATERMPGGLGITMAIIGAISLALGLMLMWALIPTYRHVRVMRNHHVAAPDQSHDGKRIAFEGEIQVNDLPLLHPFRGSPCAAYTYTISRTGTRRTSDGSSTSTQVAVAQGFHFLESQIQGVHANLALLCLPEVEDELRENLKGRDKREQLRKLLEQVQDKPSGGQEERLGQLLELQRSAIRSASVDYNMLSQIPDNIDSMQIEETCLPINQTMCLVGTYDAAQGGLSAGGSFLGAKLAAYQGTRSEVIRRMAEDNRKFRNIMLVLLGLGIVLLGIPITFG